MEWYLHSLNTDTKQLWPSICIEMWNAPTDPAVKMAVGRALRVATEHISSIGSEDPRYGVVRDWLKMLGYVLMLFS